MFLNNVQSQECEFFLKMGHPGLFLFIFIFSIFTTNIWTKCPSSIWCWDSNPQPSEHESPPITNRPGRPPFLCWMTTLTNQSALFQITVRYIRQKFVCYIGSSIKFNLTVRNSGLYCEVVLATQ